MLNLLVEERAAANENFERRLDVTVQQLQMDFKKQLAAELADQEERFRLQKVADAEKLTGRLKEVIYILVSS